jgi:ferredoxin
MSWTIAADREVCIGSGMCVTCAPATFDQDAEAKVVLLDPAGDDLDTVRAAVEACPTRALTLHEGPLTIEEEGGAA